MIDDMIQERLSNEVQRLGTICDRALNHGRVERCKALPYIAALHIVFIALSQTLQQAMEVCGHSENTSAAPVTILRMLALDTDDAWQLQDSFEPTQ